MKLVFLHGAPATGKLTVARSLLEIVPGQLYDNHVAIDFVRSLFDFGSAGFDELVDSVDLLALTCAAKYKLPLIVKTYCYSDPDDLPRLEAFEKIWIDHGGELLPVFLHCPDEDAASRVGNADRISRGKLVSKESLIRFRSRYTFKPVPRNNCITFDTGSMPANDVAKAIVSLFKL